MGIPEKLAVVCGVSGAIVAFIQGDYTEAVWAGLTAFWVIVLTSRLNDAKRAS